MKKLLCLFLLATTCSLQAKTPGNKLGVRNRVHHLFPRPAGAPQIDRRAGFFEVTLQDLQITDSGIIATIEGKEVPVRLIRVAKEGKIFVKPRKEKTVTCQQCNHEYSAFYRVSTCPQCNTENQRPNNKKQ